MLHNAITDRIGQKIDDGGMDFGGRGKGPAFTRRARRNLGNLIGQLFQNPAVGFVFEFAFGNGSLVMMPPGGLGHGKSSGEIGEFIGQLAVGVGGVEGLDQMQAWAAGGRFRHLVGLETAAVGYNDETRSVS